MCVGYEFEQEVVLEISNKKVIFDIFSSTTSCSNSQSTDIICPNHLVRSNTLYKTSQTPKGEFMAPSIFEIGGGQANRSFLPIFDDFAI